MYRIYDFPSVVRRHILTKNESTTIPLRPRVAMTTLANEATRSSDRRPIFQNETTSFPEYRTHTIAVVVAEQLHRARIATDWPRPTVAQ